MQSGGLVPPDQAPPEDEGQIGVGQPFLRRLSLRVDGEARLLEQAAEIGLAGREQEDSRAAVSLAP